MSGQKADLHVIEAAISEVRQVRSVSALVAFARSDGGVSVVARVGLPPRLRLPEVVQIIAEIELAVTAADPTIQNVYIEPDIAADAATPTESIVIRALD